MKSPYTRSWRHTAGPLMWAIVMGLVCAAGPALAQTETGEEGTAPEEPTGETTEFDAYVAAAAEAFQAKNYADALLNFQRAYELDPDPAILFNLGVIADKMGDYELAFTYFNDFVMLPDVDVDDREKALTRLEQVRKLRDLQAEKDKPKKEEKKPAVEAKSKSTTEAEAKKAAELKASQDAAKAAAEAKPVETKPAEVKPVEAKPKETVADPKAEAKNCYDRAVKYIGQRKYQDAKNELERCLSLDPTNTDAKKLLDRVNIIMRLEAK